MAYSEKPNLGLSIIDRMPPNGGPNFNSLLRELTGNVDQIDRRLRWIVFEPQHEPTLEVPYPSGIVCVRSDAGVGSSRSAFYIPKTWPTNGVYAAEPFDKILETLEANDFTFYNGVPVDAIPRGWPGKSNAHGQSLLGFVRNQNNCTNDFYHRTGIDPEHAFLVGSRITRAQIIAGEVEYEFLSPRDEQLRRDRWEEAGLDYPLVGISDGERLPCLSDIYREQAQQHQSGLRDAA